jgi:hypothetical protein
MRVKLPGTYEVVITPLLGSDEGRPKKYTLTVTQ